jgi:hypothetical protein
MVDGVELNGEPVKPSNRFWSSLHVRFGFTGDIFRYFAPCRASVFSGSAKLPRSDKVQWCIERDHNIAPTLLAVTNPKNGQRSAR